MSLAASPEPAWWESLAGTFGLGELRNEASYVARGDMGEIWRLRTTSGSWAVKILFSWSPTDPRPADVEFQLKAAAAGVRLPIPMLTETGEALIGIGGRHARVYEWVDLGPTLSIPVSAETAVEVGRLLGVIHSLHPSVNEPVDDWFWEVPDAEDWLVLWHKANTEGAPWSSGLRRVLPQIAALSELVTEPAGPMAICHRDFEPSNIYRPYDGAGLVVLDWENAGPLPCLQELGSTVIAWTTAGARSEKAGARALVDAYLAATGLATLDAEPQDLFSTYVATTVNYLRVMAENALGDDPVQRSYAEGRVNWHLNRGLDDVALAVAAATEALGVRWHLPTDQRSR